MEQPNDPRLQRRRPTDAELDRAAEITADDVDIAVETFRQYAPPEARQILAAEPTDAA